MLGEPGCKQHANTGRQPAALFLPIIHAHHSMASLFALCKLTSQLLMCSPPLAHSPIHCGSATAATQEFGNLGWALQVYDDPIHSMLMYLVPSKVHDRLLQCGEWQVFTYALL